MATSSETLPADEICRSLVQQMDSLCLEMRSQSERHQHQLCSLPEEGRLSALNLLHYLVLRNRDLRVQQEQLVGLGLSSLGRLEAHVMPTIEAVSQNLRLLLGEPVDAFNPGKWFAESEALAERLQRNTVALLGTHPGRRRVYIMVTMPTEAANEYLLVHSLLDSGMDCIRINCAHDDPETWARMIRNLHHAERATGRKCRVLMDLGGPKLRTGDMERIPGVLKVRPVRGRDGAVLRPARVWLQSHIATSDLPVAADASLVVDGKWLDGLKSGDRIRFKDARGSSRTWRVRDVSPNGCWVDAKKTAYIMNGVELIHIGAGQEGGDTAIVDSLTAQEGVIELRNGDTVLLDSSGQPGRPAYRDDDGVLLNPGVISLTIPEIYRDCCPGETVCFDDGRVTGMIEEVNDRQIRVRVTQTRKPMEKLRSDKGINFPETALDLPALSAKDLRDLDFAALHADMVGLSFTNQPVDVAHLRKELSARNAAHVSLVVKIETKRGFRNLPGILLEALKFPACGVMIARGDLAVETGFERMAEVQEEILWVCEAAHVPVIWATQVLETLTKSGQATRAEITDAAMGQAAECVMLNKGPYITRAVLVLDNILRRMQGHHAKKRSMLRKLELGAASIRPTGLPIASAPHQSCP